MSSVRDIVKMANQDATSKGIVGKSPASSDPAMAPKGSHSTITGIPVGLTLSIFKPSGKNMKSTDRVADGHWDAAEQKWTFSGDDDSLTQWLDNAFAQPVIGRDGRTTGSNKLPVGSMAFVAYMKDVMLPRKGLTMKWEIKS